MNCILLKMCVEKDFVHVHTYMDFHASIRDKKNELMVHIQMRLFMFVGRIVSWDFKIITEGLVWIIEVLLYL